MTKRELILPLKYKLLVKLVASIDQTMVFLKRCRKQEFLLFEDICGSVKKTFGRELNVNILRQVLAICPEFYTQAYSPQHKVTLDVPSAVDITGEEVRDQRKQIISKRLLARTMAAHRQFCEERGLREGDVLQD